MKVVLVDLSRRKSIDEGEEAEVVAG